METWKHGNMGVRTRTLIASYLCSHLSNTRTVDSKLLYTIIFR
jgi:hypothetical protein